MITSKRLTGSGNTEVYTSSGVNAITTIIVCNTGAPPTAPSEDPTDETIRSADITLNLIANGGGSSSDSNTIVKNLTIPAGETVFFSEERVVLGDGDSIYATASVGNLITITVSTLAV